MQPTNPGPDRPIARYISNKLNPGFFLGLICLLLGVQSMAWASPGNHQPPPLIIDSPDATHNLTPYSEFLLDTESTLTLEQIRKGHHDLAFSPAHGRYAHLGFNNHHTWLRFALHNNSDQPIEQLLRVLPGHFADVVFYTGRKNDDTRTKREHLRRAGFQQSPPWGDLPFRAPLYRILLDPHETRTFHLLIKAEHSLVYALQLEPVAITSASRGSLAESFYLLLLGFVFALVIYNSALWASYRKRVYGYYAAFLLTTALAIAVASGIIGVQHLPFQQHNSHIEASLILLSLISSLLFARSFLESRRYSKALDRALILLVSITLFCFLLSLLMSPVAALVTAYALTLFVAALFIPSGLYCWMLNIPYTGLCFLLRMPLTFSALTVIPMAFGFWSIPVEIPLVMAMATAIEGALMTFGLGLRQHNKNQLQLETHRQYAMQEATWNTRSRILSQLSHEIRTPMSGILGMAEILADTPLTPNQKDCVRTIQTSGEGLLRILDDVLEYSRLEGEDIRLDREPFDLNHLLLDSLELFRERAEEKQIELILHVHTNVPDWVEGDASRLRQVLTNLLGVSIRNAQSGELIIDMARDPSGRSEHLTVEIEGSALALADNLLDAEATTDNSHQDNNNLNLSIAWQLVDIMQGRCGIRQGKQSPLLWLTLPLPACGGPEKTMLDTSSLEGRRILVVDDSPTLTRVIRQQAIPWGMHVTACHDPREALASIRTQININEPYYVDLLDQHMPGMSGMQLAARIHEDPYISNPPILIMLTGVSSAPTSAMARNVGIHRVLNKPLSGAQLKQTLASELGASVEAREASSNEHIDTQIITRPDPTLAILVAEDHPLSQKVIRGMLNKLELKADIVSNGREALDAAQKKNYDLILMDCEMPEMDGFEAAQKIRQLGQQQQKVPIVALTAHILREHRERSLASGMNDHITKPVELNTLRKVILKYSQGRNKNA